MSADSKGKAGQDSSADSEDYRHFVGPTERYDLAAAAQFNLLTYLGLREDHYLLDIGCGSLRAGRLFIPYLLPGRYFGIEPEQWLIDEGIRNEVGKDLVDIKRPAFSNDSNFTLSFFNQQFDFILANSVFSHASQAQISRCLAEANEVMRPSSIMAATFIEGDEDYAGDGWVYPGCVAYTPECMARLAEEQGMMCKLIDWPHPGNQRWLLVTHPEHVSKVRLPDDAVRLAFLENELRFTQQRLSRLQQHPYVRFGLKVRQLLQRIRRLGR